MAELKGSRKLALIERDRKMAIISKFRAEGYTPTEISEKTGYPKGTITSYSYLMNKDMAKLALEMDPKKLSAKKAEIINGLLYDLTLTHLQIATSQKGYSPGKSAASRDADGKFVKAKALPRKVNEMAVAALIRQSVDIRMKIATLLGLANVEITLGGEVKHVFEVKSALPAPSAAIVISQN
jgi:hypothetical protein